MLRYITFFKVLCITTSLRVLVLLYITASMWVFVVYLISYYDNSDFKLSVFEPPLKSFSTNLQDLFFQYSLNNFLHAQVEICVKYAFCCVNPPPPPASKASTQIAFDDASWNNNNVATADEDQAKTGSLNNISGNFHY